MAPAAGRYRGEPVAIIGAGPVGQTAALLLARWGIPTVLLDQRARRGWIGSRSICQQRDVLDIWAAIGAGRQIADEGLTWHTSRTYYRDAELFTVRFADPGRSAFPPFVNLSQSRTEQILDALITEEPLVDVRWSHQVVGIAQDDDGVTLRFSNGMLRAPYVLACAGGHTEVRDLLGVRFDGHSFADRFLICDIRADLGDWSTERRFHFDPEWNPGRQVLIHPCPDSTYRIDWQVPPDFDVDTEQRTGGLDRRIRQIIGDRPYEIIWRSVYTFSTRCVDRMVAGRVLLAGDCAHLMAPFGARGLNSGVPDAENAAWKLAFVLRGWAPPALLDSYHDERHAAARENVEITSATMRFLVPQTAADRAYRRDVLERALVDPAAAGEVDSGRLAEPYWYVDSPLTTADPDRPFPGRPPRGSVPPALPGVLVPDVPIRPPAGTRATRLRELVRDGFLLLATAPVDLPAMSGPPLAVHLIDDLDCDGVLAGALGARAGEAWLIRPDGHAAAVLPTGDAAAITTALRRALGHPVTAVAGAG